jgi:hypothetical protein
MQSVINPKLITREEFLAQFHDEAQETLIKALARPDVTGVVCFENLQMDSSHFGERSGLVFGPGCTYKLLADVLAGRLGDVPSRFKYPVSYWLKPNSN